MALKDTFFSFRRFGDLLRKEMVESGRKNLWRILLMYGILSFFMIWIAYFPYRYFTSGQEVLHDPAHKEIGVIFLFGLAIMGMIAASFTMEPMQRKIGRTAYLLLPATPFEKFASRWLIYTFGFLVVYLLCFRLADWTRVGVYRFFYPEASAITPFSWSSLLGPMERDAPFHTPYELSTACAAYLTMQSWFVMGSTFWPRFSLVKSGVCLGLVVVGYVGLCVFTVSTIQESGKVLEPPSIPLFPKNESEVLLFFTFVLLFAALFLWTLAYYRTREDELIERT